jgi:hypothetical protein
MSDTWIYTDAGKLFPMAVAIIRTVKRGLISTKRIKKMVMLRSPSTAGERKFDVYVREVGGYVHKVGTVFANNKIQADTKVRMMYGRTLTDGRVAYAVDPMPMGANA